MPEHGHGPHAHESAALRAAYAQSLAPYLSAVSALAAEAIHVQLLRFGGEVPRVGGMGRAVEELASLIQKTQQTADLLGRGDTLRVARRMVGAPPVKPPMPPGVPPGSFPVPFGGGGGVPRVPFNEAVADVLARDPVLLKSAEEVATAYNESHVFSMARAVEQETVARAQKAVAKALHEGEGPVALARNIREIARKAGEDMAGWTRNYAETVSENALATAYSAGRFRQMADTETASVIGALEFVGPNDSSKRPNHRAALGLVAAPDDPVWDVLAPPLGHRCRDGLALVDWLTLKRRGLVLPNGRVRPATIPPGAHPDPGFRHTGRPDRVLYGFAS